MDIWPRTEDDGKSELFESVSYYVSSEILHHLSEAVSSAKLGDLSYSVRLIDNQIESLLAERHLARRGRSLNAACVIKGLQCREPRLRASGRTGAPRPHGGAGRASSRPALTRGMAGQTPRCLRPALSPELEGPRHRASDQAHLDPRGSIMSSWRPRLCPCPPPLPSSVHTANLSGRRPLLFHGGRGQWGDQLGSSHPTRASVTSEFGFSTPPVILPLSRAKGTRQGPLGPTPPALAKTEYRTFPRLPHCHLRGKG